MEKKKKTYITAESFFIVHLRFCELRQWILEYQPSFLISPQRSHSQQEKDYYHETFMNTHDSKKKESNERCCQDVTASNLKN